MQISILGIDVENGRGAVAARLTMRRQTLIKFVGRPPTCAIAVEACCGAHHLGRLFTARGHEVQVMLPEYVHC